MLSVCIGNYNRSIVLQEGIEIKLLSQCIASLIVACAGIMSELVIADYSGEVSEWVLDNSEIPVRVVRCKQQFNRGGARNTAARYSQGETLFFCDADMVTPKEVVNRGIEVVNDGKALFPIYQRYMDIDHKKIIWGSGHGNAIVSRKHWEESGGYPEKLTYGHEDTDFGNWFRSRGLIVREKFENYFHLWHPFSGETGA